jgi:hypothetical protein
LPYGGTTSSNWVSLKSLVFNARETLKVLLRRKP